MSQKVGFVGVGRMGANMARRLKDCGYDVSAVYDIRSEAAAELATELGTTAATTLAQVTELSDVIITVVIDDDSMRTIFASEGDSLLTGAEGACSSTAPRSARQCTWRPRAAAKAAGAESLEGCMASSITQARDGTLYLMLGGDKATYDKVEELLGKLSTNKRYVGTAGKAAQVKALVNMVMNINTAGLAEGLGLADALGLDLNMVMEIFSQTGANSRVLETDGEDMRDRDHECYFSGAHAAKDSGIALALGQSAGTRPPDGRRLQGAVRQDDRKRHRRTGQVRRGRADIQGSKRLISMPHSAMGRAQKNLFRLRRRLGFGFFLTLCSAKITGMALPPGKQGWITHNSTVTEMDATRPKQWPSRSISSALPPKRRKCA